MQKGWEFWRCVPLDPPRGSNRIALPGCELAHGPSNSLFVQSSRKSVYNLRPDTTEKVPKAELVRSPGSPLLAKAIDLAIESSNS